MIRQPHPQLFEFERISSENFAYIPLCVRFHLDRTGLRISLDEWQQLPLDDRIALSSYAVGDDAVDEFVQSNVADVADEAYEADAIEQARPFDASGASGAGRSAHPADDFAVQLGVWMQQYNRRPPVSSAPPTELPGDAVDRIADGVLAQCEWAGLQPISLEDWQRLSRFQRYALAKLSRKPKANHDFVPAMQEFGLVRA